jgi:hypothetical protein
MMKRLIGVLVVVGLLVCAGGCQPMKEALRDWGDDNPTVEPVPVDETGNGVADAFFGDKNGNGAFEADEEIPGTRQALLDAKDIDDIGVMVLEIGLGIFGVGGTLAGVLSRIANRRLAQRITAGESVRREIVASVKAGLDAVSNSEADKFTEAMGNVQTEATEKAVKLAKAEL